mmetsp:Transcript_19700/g.45765  ORF Transcript_19700/g.45765 Transcript_19700/m.45765 type:complete len:81 (-) Transcript_19700:398-640(-)
MQLEQEGNFPVAHFVRGSVELLVVELSCLSGCSLKHRLWSLTHVHHLRAPASANWSEAFVLVDQVWVVSRPSFPVSTIGN